MPVTPIAVITGIGGLAAAVATAGLCLSIMAGGAPQRSLIGLLVAGVVLLVIAFVWCFEEQSRLRASRMDRSLRGRQHAPPPVRAASAQSSQMHTSKN